MLVRHRRIAPMAILSLIRRSRSTPISAYPVGGEYLEARQGCSMSASPSKFIPPCIPTTAKAIPHGAAWLHEPKLDGYSFQIVKEGDRVRLYSRSGYDWTK